LVKKRRIPLLQATLTAICAVAPAHADYSDCRTCHYATTIDSTAPDFTSYFVAAGHHPVRVSYPIRADYNQPLSSLSGILFFDRNGNGIPDPDEIQIFSTTTTTTLTTTSTTKSRKGGSKSTTVTETTWVIDCASCHTEHGTTPPDPAHAVDYVRNAGGDQLLCITCHNL
jgi:hypothetical protein